MPETTINFERTETGETDLRVTLEERADGLIYIQNHKLNGDYKIMTDSEVRVRVNQGMDETFTGEATTELKPGFPMMIAKPHAELPTWEEANERLQEAERSAY